VTASVPQKRARLEINYLNVLIAICVLVLAIVLDLVLGDPSPTSPWKLQYKLHPTVWMGKLTKILESYFKNPNPKIEKLNGVFLALIVIIAFALPTYIGLRLVFTFLGFLVYAVVAFVILKFAICIKLETDWAKAAAKAIENDDLVEARKYSHFSRRDAQDLTGQQIGSAVIESMAENLTDFKLSPILSYALLGVSGAIAFRAINTLDGTVGFKDSEHIHIGWFSATIDKIVNYVPARLAAGLIILGAFILGEDYKNAWNMARRDNAKTPSINHGWPMAAMAGALRVRLEKPGKYILGEPLDDISSGKIIRALRIRNAAIVLGALLSLPIIFLVRLFLFPF
jgi:adenosylcobinamide-phosphate synthase